MIITLVFRVFRVFSRPSNVGCSTRGCGSLDGMGRRLVLYYLKSPQKTEFIIRARDSPGTGSPGGNAWTPARCSKPPRWRSIDSISVRFQHKGLPGSRFPSDLSPQKNLPERRFFSCFFNLHRVIWRSDQTLARRTAPPPPSDGETPTRSRRYDESSRSDGCPRMSTRPVSLTLIYGGGPVVAKPKAGERTFVRKACQPNTRSHLAGEDYSEA